MRTTIKSPKQLYKGRVGSFKGVATGGRPVWNSMKVPFTVLMVKVVLYRINKIGNEFNGASTSYGAPVTPMGQSQYDYD